MKICWVWQNFLTEPFNFIFFLHVWRVRSFHLNFHSNFFHLFNIQNSIDCCFGAFHDKLANANPTKCRSFACMYAVLVLFGVLPACRECHLFFSLLHIPIKTLFFIGPDNTVKKSLYPWVAWCRSSTLAAMEKRRSSFLSVSLWHPCAVFLDFTHSVKMTSDCAMSACHLLW